MRNFENLYTADEALGAISSALGHGQLNITRNGLRDGMTPEEVYAVFRRKITGTGVMLNCGVGHFISRLRYLREC